MSELNNLKINGIIYPIEGKSAYEVAVEQGFEGTEQEWLASLKGEQGDAGTFDDLDGQLYHKSKNLFVVKEVGIYPNSVTDGVVTWKNHANYITSELIPVADGENFIVSINGAPASVVKPLFYLADGVTPVLVQSFARSTFSVPAKLNIAYVQVSAAGSGAATVESKVQCERGNAITEYMPPNVTYLSSSIIVKEVEDMRVGYDGTVYDSAGDAMRDQMRRLHPELLSSMVGRTRNLFDPFTCVDNKAIISVSGALKEHADHWVTDIFAVPSGTTELFASAYIYHIGCYDAEMNYLGMTDSGTGVLLENTTFARVQIAKTSMVFEDRFGLVIADERVEYSPTYKLDKQIIASDMADYSAGAIGEYLFKFPITNPFYVSDHTFIGNELFAVNACVKNDHTDTAPVTVYSVDPVTKTATYLRQFTHNLGHANTVDYCPGNNCLIMGNGSADATLPGKIFILPNPSTTENWSFSDCIVIDMAAENWGIKMQALWGEHNDGQYNIVYVITNNNADVHKIMLTRDANGNFDGGYIVLGAWHNATGLDVNQGSTYHNGKIWAAIGHAQMWVTETQLLSDGTMKQTQRKDLMYDEMGKIKISPFAEGIAIKDGYVYVGGSDSTIRVYKLIY